MGKKVILLILFSLLFCALFAQQGEYRRKSVSSLGYTWYAPDTYRRAFSEEFYGALVDRYIEVDRFDFNALPPGALKSYKSQMDQVQGLDFEAFARILERTVGKMISELLLDPELQEARREGLEEESARIRLARTKGKDFGLTEEQLFALMNSAYVYFPYITAANWQREENDIKYNIKGGIVWYQVQIDAQGEVKMVMVESGSAEGEGNASVGSSGYNTFNFAGTKYNTTPYEYAMFSGMQAWTNNLSIIMRRIPDFSLSAQILQKKSRTRFTSSLGLKDGVYLDDGFYVVEHYETAGGEIKKKRIGYGRLIKNVDNRKGKNPDQYSEIRMHWGKGILPGAELEEYPLMGSGVVVSPAVSFDMYVPAAALNYPHSWYSGLMVTEDIDFAVGVDIDFFYNLAPIIGFTQTFFKLDMGLNLIPVVYSSPDDSSMFTYLITLYPGLSKKFWVGRGGIGFTANLGMNLLNSDYTNGDEEYNTKIMSLGAKVGVDYHYMFSPTLQLNLGVTKGIDLVNIGAEQTYKGYTYELPSYISDDIDMGFTRVHAGVSWHFSSLKTNMFGFWDVLKRH